MKQFTPSLIAKPFIVLCFFLLAISQTSFSQAGAEEYRKNAQIESQKTGRAYGIAAAMCIIGCFAIGIWLKKRQLKRTNKYGTEEFSSTRGYVASEASEGLANVVAVILFIVGIFLVLASITKCN